MNRRHVGATIWPLLLLAALVRADETIPPSPAHHLTDDGHFLSDAAGKAVHADMMKFETDTTNEIVVAIFPHMQSSDTIKNYSMRVFNNWGVGESGPNNGVLILIFSQDRTLRITVGSGLEKTLTDKICQDIIDTKMVPSLKAGNPDKAVTDGVHAIMAILHPAATSTAPASAPAAH